MVKKLIAKLRSWLRLGRAVGLIWLVVFLSLRVADPAPLEALRLRVFDFYQFFMPRVIKPLPVAIVDIDDASLKKYGQWPWPRNRLARLVSGIQGNGAVAMAFDIVFSEPDRLSPGLLAAELKDLDGPTRAKLEAYPNNDRVMADAMKRARVILGQSGLHKFLDATPKRPPEQSGLAVLGVKPDPFLLTYPGLLRNIPTLEATAKGKGLFTIAPDLDGVVRRVALVMKAEQRILPALSTELLRIATGGRALLIKSADAGIRSLVVGGVEVPTDRNGRLWIHFSGHEPSRYVSAADVLAGTAGARTLRGKLVFIGTSAVGLHDLKPTPVHPAMPGVEIHAQVLENILSKAALKRPAYAIGAELSLALVIGLAFIVLVPMVGALYVSLFGAGVAVLLAGTSWYLFIQKGMLFDVVFPLLASFSVFLLLVFVNYFREETQRRQIRSAFGQYLSPLLVEELASHPDKLSLGGETRNLTILFSDVRGFTTISELYKDDPQGLTSLMNSFLTPISNAIVDHNGTIDKYMGDAVMAFWNAPLDDPDHSANACRAALEMLVRLEALNREREQEAQQTGGRFAPIRIGVGINTADCVVGNLGSEMQFDYSVMGDGVNLASRLEGQSKTYGLPVIIGSQTNWMLNGRLATIEIDNIRVKGKNEPEVIHAVLGDEDMRGSEEFETTHRLFTEMLELYRNRRWKNARETLRLCRKSSGAFGLQTLLDLYEDRIRVFVKKPPPKDWDGVATLTQK